MSDEAKEPHGVTVEAYPGPVKLTYEDACRIEDAVRHTLLEIYQMREWNRAVFQPLYAEDRALQELIDKIVAIRRGLQPFTSIQPR